MSISQNQSTTEQLDEINRLVQWILKNWKEWKMLCHPAISDADTRAKRQAWIEALKKFSKSGFPALILVFMTKCYYMEGEAKEVIESAVINRILATWDENTIDYFISYLTKVDNWDSRELPIVKERKDKIEELQRIQTENWLNPPSKPQ